MTDWIGWAASGVFLASYACRDPKRLRLLQAAAALIWALYGTLISAAPIVVANLLVASAAVWSSLSRSKPDEPMAAAAATDRVRPAGEPDLSRIS